MDYYNYNYQGYQTQPVQPVQSVQNVQNVQNPVNTPAQLNNQNMNQGKFPTLKYKYGHQITCIEREEMNCYAELSWNPSSEEDLLKGNVAGLDSYGRSRIDLFIFKFEEKKSAKFSLNPREIFLIEKKMNALIDNFAITGEKPKKNLPACYTVRIKGGNFQGKTPAEFLIANPTPEGRNAILAQRDYMMKNINHPKFGKTNKEQVDAINQAVTLFDNKQLNPQMATSSVKEIEKFFKTPSPKNFDSRGLIKAREMTILFDMDSGNFNITIMNCMAPPIQGKSTGAKLEQSTDLIKYSFNMTMSEFSYLITESCNKLRDFGKTTIPSQMKVYNSYN